MSVYILYTYEMLLISNKKIKKWIYEDTPDHCNPRNRSLNIMRSYRMQNYCKIIVQNRVVTLGISVHFYIAIKIYLNDEVLGM